MKKIICLLIAYSFCFGFCYSKTDESDINSKSFIEIGRYAKTFEINEVEEPCSNASEDNNFEQEAIKDVSRRYESNAVELKLDDTDDSTVENINSSRLFSLKVNETQYKIEQQIKSENMIWDTSKSFSQAVLNDTRRMAPIPSVVNSQKLNAEVSKNVSASLGQTYLFNSLGPSMLFVRANESTYNTGSVIKYKGEKMNASLGSFSSSYNHSSSGGALLSTAPVQLPKNSGNISVGGGIFANEMFNDNKSTGGLFGEYSFKRLKLNAQIGQSRYTYDNNIDTSVYFMPEYQLTNSLALKTRFIRNISQNTNQDELVLSYKPLKNNNNLEIEINASNQYSDTENIKQRLKLSTTFRI